MQLTKSSNPSTDKFVKTLEATREEAAAAMAKALEHAKANYDCGKCTSQGYQMGDQVWLEATNLKEAHPSKKLSAKQYSPFKVLDKVGQSAYRLKLPKNW